MEKPLLTEAITVIMAETMYSAEKLAEVEDKIEDTKEKVHDLEYKVDEANQVLIVALKDSFQEFKIESDEEIKCCEKSIAEFKARMGKGKKENKAECEKRLVWLEQKISDLKNKLYTYKEEGQDKWTSYKIDFNHEMDDLEKALKHFIVNKDQQIMTLSESKVE